LPTILGKPPPKFALRRETPMHPKGPRAGRWQGAYATLRSAGLAAARAARFVLMFVAVV